MAERQLDRVARMFTLPSIAIAIGLLTFSLAACGGEDAGDDIDDFTERVLARMGTAIDEGNAVEDQWNAIADQGETLPSRPLAALAREEYSIAAEFEQWLASLADDPVLENSLVAAWWADALRWWSATSAAFLIKEQYSLRGADANSVEAAYFNSGALNDQYLRTKCSLWQQQRYPDTEDVCALAKDRTEARCRMAWDLCGAGDCAAWDRITDFGRSSLCDSVIDERWR
ncbi:MAG: hypothetical protein OXI51_08470 [Chloroflexota bacterium]|nr:hypothetical protein [Chloroflexota bacterium]